MEGNTALLIQRGQLIITGTTLLTRSISRTLNSKSDICTFFARELSLPSENSQKPGLDCVAVVALAMCVCVCALVIVPSVVLRHVLK